MRLVQDADRARLTALVSEARAVGRGTPPVPVPVPVPPKREDLSESLDSCNTLTASSQSASAE